MSRSTESASYHHAKAAVRSTTLFQLRERVDVEGGETMLRSKAFAEVKATNESMWSNLRATVQLAKALGGYLPVRYYMHEAQEGFGRMKSEVMVSGMQPIPYVRMWREARAALASKYYWDVDMENCQPWLLEQKLKSYNIPCPQLSRYIADRNACLKEVMTACEVGRDDAKRLFIRVMFFGGIKGWLSEHPHAKAGSMPSWVRSLRDELRSGATALMKLPLLSQLKDMNAKKGVSMMPAIDEGRENMHAHSDPLASIMAMYLQTLECECVRALVRTIHGDCRAVGGIIYDGVLVEKSADENSLPEAKLRSWEDAVKTETGLTIRLVVKEFETPAEWSMAAPQSATSPKADTESWMDGRHLLSYDDVKAKWEASTFKVIKSGNYVREDPEDQSRSVMSERQLMDSYRHLHYADVKTQDSGTVTVTASHPFIARWIKDPEIRSFKTMVFMPPPLVAPPNAYNIWDGFEVERQLLDSPAEHVTCEDWSTHPSVKAFLEFFDKLMGSSASYYLDWHAQIFQQPAKKTGISILLKGQEGVGKNRATDLSRAMHGKDKFLQTATPANTLYGRFNRQREGKLLIVINESSGADNFAANDIIKDMITCDEFQSEGKGTNAYTMNCFARFLFTTNNDNCLKVNPDSRRYVVIEVSSALKGQTEYFKRLSDLIDDRESRYAFYRYLMSRDISKIDWINDRPVTEYYMQMVSLNLPYEHQYIKSLIIQSCQEAQGFIDGMVVKMKTEDMFKSFMEWKKENNVTSYETTTLKFGHKLTQLVRNEEKSTGFVGLTKKREGKGVYYKLDIAALAKELVESRWATPEEMRG